MAVFLVSILVLISLPFSALSRGYTEISDFRARPPIHVFGSAAAAPQGLSPSAIKKIYHLPKSGGHGTIAIIGAFDDLTIENDLKVFSKQFGLPQAHFEKHLMDSSEAPDSGWAMETSLDVEWAHAIAPTAKILLVSAKTDSGRNLLDAVDYAASRSDVVAVSMSWGGAEFASEASLDNHFQSSHAVFFASSGDNGAGVSWPAVSKNVVAVGGTSLGTKTEAAWSGSGGGVSSFEAQPNYQASFAIPRASGMRAIPDVAYDADPASGFSIYMAGKWYVVGGTSAGAPQWAAIRSLGLSASNDNFYADKASSKSSKFFHDIVSGSNGDCKYYCDARKRYDYVTGLGSPLTWKF